MRHRGVKIIGTLCLGLNVLACGGTPTTPASGSASVAGDWVGPITDAQWGAGTASLSISQSGAALSGNWTITYAISGINDLLAQLGDLAGTVSGTASSSGAIPVLAPTNPQGCAHVFTMTAIGATMVGTWSYAQGCSTPDSGTFSLSKQ